MVAMGANVYVGLAVSSHSDGVLTTAKLDNVRLTKSLPPTPTISSPSPSLTWKVGDTINFSGSATEWSDAGAASHNIRAPASTATYTATFVPQTGTAGAHETRVASGGTVDALAPGGLSRDQTASIVGAAARLGGDKTSSAIQQTLAQQLAQRGPASPRLGRTRLSGTANHADHAMHGEDTAGRIFTVNSTADLEDRVPGDGLCNAGGGLCTLRAALAESELSEDAAASPTAIYFDIPEPGVPTIRIQEDVST